MSSGRCWLIPRSELRARRALAAMALVVCAGACTGDADRAGERSGDGDSASAPAVAVAAADSACPASGSWAWCSVLQRLDRAGLVPLHDSTVVASEPPLTRRGSLVRVGRAELEIYLYPDVASREREQRLLDSAAYVPYGASQTFRAEPTLIGNANLLAILHSNNSRQRERVGDALTAGPPQP